jgi:alpha,alpha-trehalase
MASWVFCRVLDLFDNLPSDHLKHLKRRLDITDHEIELWTAMSKLMFVPVMPNGIIAQFEGYEKLEEFPGFLKTGKIDHATMKKLLDENLGYLNQYKISKQADLLMIGYLFTQRELTDIIKNLGYPAKLASLEKMSEYYLPRTSNESTLSRVALSWVLSRLSPKSASRILKAAAPGNDKKSTSQTSKNGAGSSAESGNEHDSLPENTPGGLFYAALGSDYYNVAARGTAKSGIHMGAMAGTVDIVQRCYTGISARDDALWLDPSLSDQLIHLRFTLHYRGQSLHFDFNHDRLQVRARHSGANPIKIGYADRLYDLKSGQTRIFKIKRKAKGS